jgi:hypothetical protein
MNENKSHTLKLRVDEFTTITVTYNDTELDWVEFMWDAAQLLTEYAYKDNDFVSVTTTVRH